MSKRSTKPRLPCPVPGCDRGRLAESHLTCGTCWHRVPVALRTRVWNLFREQRGSEEHRLACGEAIRAAAVRLKEIEGEADD